MKPELNPRYERLRRTMSSTKSSHTSAGERRFWYNVMYGLIDRSIWARTLEIALSRLEAALLWDALVEEQAREGLLGLGFSTGFAPHTWLVILHTPGAGSEV